MHSENNCAAQRQLPAFPANEDHQLETVVSYSFYIRSTILLVLFFSADAHPPYKYSTDRVSKMAVKVD